MKLISTVFTLLALFVSTANSQNGYVSPKEVNLDNPQLDSIQYTTWLDYPIFIHRRTEKQINSMIELFDDTPDSSQRYLAYQAIARSKGNEFASGIREFTEKYIADKNVYMSELKEFGIYSLASPILGCAIQKIEYGFIDPCNGVEFDFAGKVTNHKGFRHLRLTIPPHRIHENKLVFLENYKPEKVIDFTPDILAMNVSPVEKAMFAIDWERLDVLKIVVEEFPEVLQESNSVGSTVLHIAAFHEETLEYLLGFPDIDINQMNDAGLSALMFAVWMEKYENAFKLVRKGAKIEKYTDNGKEVRSLYQFLIEEAYFDEDKAVEVVQDLKLAQLNP